MDDSSDPNVSKCHVVQRRAPVFGKGSIVSDLLVYGGLHRDGVVLKGGHIKNIKSIFPAGHGMLIGGSTVLNPVVSYVNPSSPTANLFHGYGDAGSNEYWKETKIINPVVKKWRSLFSTIVSTHGDGTKPVNKNITVENIKAEDIGMIFSGTDIDGVIKIKGGVIENARSIGYAECNAIIESMNITLSEIGQSEETLKLPKQGVKTTIRKTKMSGSQMLFKNQEKSGSVLIEDSHISCGADLINGIWSSIQYDHEGIEIVRSSISCNAGSGFIRALNIVSGTGVMKFKDSMAHNIKMPANYIFENSIFSDSGMSRNLIIPDVSPAWRMGSWSKMIAVSSGTSLQQALILSSRGILSTNQGNPGSTLRYSETDLNGIAYVGNSTEKTVIAYGNNGRVIKSSGSYSEWKPINGISGDICAHITPEDGTAILMLKNGEIKKLNISDETIEAANSGITESIRCGFYDGSKYIAVFDSDDSTAGGIISSIDGINWTTVSTQTKLRTITKANGVWFAFGLNATAIYSIDGATWMNLAFNKSIDATMITTDGIETIAIAGKCSNGVGDTLIKIEVKSTGSVSDIKISEVRVEGNSIGAIKYAPYIYDGNKFISLWWVMSASEDGWWSGSLDGGWKKWSPPQLKLEMKYELENEFTILDN